MFLSRYNTFVADVIDYPWEIVFCYQWSWILTSLMPLISAIINVYKTLHMQHETEKKIKREN